MTYDSLTVLIGIIGMSLATFLTRALFFIYPPRIVLRQNIRRALNSVPAAMLVALVVPFTFTAVTLNLMLVQLACVSSGFIAAYLLKRPGMGIVIALLLFFVASSVLHLV